MGGLRKLPWHLILMKADASDKNKCLLGRKAKVCLTEIKTRRWHVETELRGRESTNKQRGCTHNRTVVFIVPQFHTTLGSRVVARALCLTARRL